MANRRDYSTDAQDEYLLQRIVGAEMEAPMDGLMMKYFVLKPKGTDVYARASRCAMLRYADEIMEDNRDFALDLVKWVTDEEHAAERESRSANAPISPDGEHGAGYRNSEQED